ncbi:TolB-like protein [Azospirillum brasilense]|nr:TolB-like protein [Azospirillum brasilense]
MTGETPPAQGWALDDRAVRTQLERILASDHFDASDRNRRFLRYVVEECLEGRAQQIKAYCIAVSVFNREPSFDPQSDPIVRLEAGRLRRSLEHYYLTAGRSDPIRIVVPKGGYAPRFERVSDAPLPAPHTVPAAEAIQRPVSLRIAGFAAVVLIAVGLMGLLIGRNLATPIEVEEALALGSHPTMSSAEPRGSEPATAWTTAPSAAADASMTIVVGPFRTTGQSTEDGALAAMLTDEIASGLANRTDLPVRIDPPQSARLPHQGFRLSGSLQGHDASVRLVVNLTDLATGTVLWSTSLDRSAGPEGAATPQALAAGIVDPVAAPQGPLLSSASARLRTKPTSSLSPRECAFLATGRHEIPAVERVALNGCLTSAASALTTSAGEAARLWSALSLLQSDAYRTERNDAALNDALAAALRATELQPASLRPLTALYTAYCLRGEYSPCFAAGHRALQASPGDAHVLGDLGLWHVEAGQSAKGLPLLEQAMERDPAQRERLLSAYSLALQRHGHPDSTKLEFEVTAAAPAQAALAVAFVQMGRMDEAKAAATRVLAADPDFARRTAREQRIQPLPPTLDAAIRSSYAMVGLAAPATDSVTR